MRQTHSGKTWKAFSLMFVQRSPVSRAGDAGSELKWLP
jgi:hypothetical protein